MEVPAPLHPADPQQDGLSINTLAEALQGPHSAARTAQTQGPALLLLPGSTTPAVFGSPLILPSQFLDSPELPSGEFLKQFSQTLSAAEPLPLDSRQLPPGVHHQSCCQMFWPIQRQFSSTAIDKSSPPATPPQPLYHSVEVSAPLYPADRQQDGLSINTPAEALQGPHSATRTAQTQGPALLLLPGSTTPAVFGSPLILPSQFLNSHELPSGEFLKQFSQTLSAAEPLPLDTRQLPPGVHHQSCCQMFWPIQRQFLSTAIDKSNPPATLPQPLYHTVEVSAPLHPADRQQDGLSINTPAEAPQRPQRHPHSPGLLLPGSTTGCCGGTQGTFHHAPYRGTVSPWSAARAFCMPRCCSCPNSNLAER